MNVLRGVVKRFDDAKGYGFVKSEGIPEDIFVHFRSIKMKGFRTLAPGDVIEFRLQRDEKGMKAVEVVRVEQEQVNQA